MKLLWKHRLAPAALVVAAASALPAQAERGVSLNFYGVPGLIDLPTAESLPDAQATATMSYFADSSRATVGFQVFDRVGVAFRYSRIANWDRAKDYTYYDRSLDFHIRVLDEGRYHPAVTVGVQDLMGTGVYSAEYIVATKTFADRLLVTAGLGWGRLGSDGELFSTGSRPPENNVKTGGTVQYKHWFRGPAAPFFGIEWKPSDRISLKFERSSDLYRKEAGDLELFERKSPYNFGAEYQATQNVRLGAYYMYGDTFGLTAQIQLNPKHPPNPGTAAGAPYPVKPRNLASAGATDTGWTQRPEQVAQIRRITAEAMSNDGMLLESMTLTGTRAVIRLRNNAFDSGPMALGRAVRALTYVLPPSVEEIVVIPVATGMALSAVSFRRSDIEAFENAPDGSAQILARTGISDAARIPAPAGDLIEGVYPRLSWSIQPFMSVSMFGGEDKLLGSVGVRGRVSYEPLPGLLLRGSVAHQLARRYEDKPSDSVLPHVRSDGVKYFIEGRTALENMTATYYFRPGENLYGRVTGGYLERMFGGVSAEILWKPIDSPLAIGAEVNWVRQRAFNGGLGFQDYSVVTGHLSGYLNFSDDYSAAIHAGRYLAGDWGATFELRREFANGWRVGAYATLTDVSHEDFGEGSFDKGLMAELPLSWLTGKPSRTTASLTMRSLARDGGQRVRVEDRLFSSVREYHKQDLTREWGLFWR